MILLIKQGLGKSICGLITKRRGQTSDVFLYQLSVSKKTEQAGFGASLVLSNIFLPGNFDPFGPKR